MEKRKGFTLVELMVVVLIVSILAAVAIPILRGRIDAAKWSEGKAMLGTIATSIRAYHAENGPTGDPPTGIVGTGATDLGFLTDDLTGTYFSSGDFSISVAVTMPTLTYTIRCVAGGGGNPPTNDFPSNPASYTLDDNGVFTAGG